MQTPGLTPRRSSILMFFSVSRRDRRSNLALSASIGVHSLLLVWILLPPKAIFIKPSSTKAGVNGTGLTYIYFPARSGEASQEQSASTRRMVLPREAKAPKRRERLSPLPEPEEVAKTEPGSAAPPAGSVYGSSAIGSPIGQEVRPALRVTGSEPRVNPDEFAGLEGSVIIEITIDERGNVVEKNLLQSLNPELDRKVLAALEDWHFLPATRDGVAIPSKEDVYYHFPVRR
jgi:periplasmic protein TonB